MQILKKITVAVAACAMSSLALAAFPSTDGPVTPTYTSFGSVAVPNDFGSPGHTIATDAVASTGFGSGGMLFLSATPRYDPPLLTNDGAGTFGATAGVSTHANTFGHTNLALWNFDWEVARPTDGGIYYMLFIDSDAGANTLFSQYTGRRLGNNTDPTDGSTPDLPFFDSSNLGFFFNNATFDPTVGGEYGFVLQAFSSSDNSVLATTAILVDVPGDGTVPEPASIALVGLALGAAGFASRRRKAAA